MSTYRIITGLAELDDPARYDDNANIRWYHNAQGSWIGTETTDVDYCCSHGCLPDLLYVRFGGTSVVTADGTTQDIEQVFGDWPDYDVHCAGCGDLLHDGDTS